MLRTHIFNSRAMIAVFLLLQAACKPKVESYNTRSQQNYDDATHEADVFEDGSSFNDESYLKCTWDIKEGNPADATGKCNGGEFSGEIFILEPETYQFVPDSISISLDEKPLSADNFIVDYGTITILTEESVKAIEEHQELALTQEQADLEQTATESIEQLELPVVTIGEISIKAQVIQQEDFNDELESELME